MKICIKKEAVLHDVANLAYVIADVNGGEDAHSLHQLADICQRGNIDRVARIMGLTACIVRDVLVPVLDVGCLPRRLYDFSAVPRNYEYVFARWVNGSHKFQAGLFTLKSLQTVIHEFFVCKIVADWLSVTVPRLSPIWREKAALSLEALRDLVKKMLENSDTGAFVRPFPPL